ncbi:MAG: hypothetical protein AAF298_24925 [Cyanobacteria bacterium P01_A01_bin.40]
MGKKMACITMLVLTELLAEADKAVKFGKAKSRNGFFAQALKRESAAIKRAYLTKHL